VLILLLLVIVVGIVLAIYVLPELIMPLITRWLIALARKMWARRRR